MGTRTRPPSPKIVLGPPEFYCETLKIRRTELCWPAPSPELGICAQGPGSLREPSGVISTTATKTPCNLPFYSDFLLHNYRTKPPSSLSLSVCVAQAAEPPPKPPKPYELLGSPQQEHHSALPPDQKAQSCPPLTHVTRYSGCRMTWSGGGGSCGRRRPVSRSCRRRCVRCARETWTSPRRAEPPMPWGGGRAKGKGGASGRGIFARKGGR